MIRAERLWNILPQVQPKWMPHVIGPSPSARLPRTTAGEKKLPWDGPSVHTVMTSTMSSGNGPPHEITADRLFVDSEGSIKLSRRGRPATGGRSRAKRCSSRRSPIDRRLSRCHDPNKTRSREWLAGHCHIKPIKQRETPLTIVNFGHRIPFAVPVEAFFTFPTSDATNIVARFEHHALVGYQNRISQCTSLPQGHRVQGRRHQMAPLEHPSPRAELAFPDPRLLFLFHPWHNLEIDGSGKKSSASKS